MCRVPAVLLYTGPVYNLVLFGGFNKFTQNICVGHPEHYGVPGG